MRIENFLLFAWALGIHRQIGSLLVLLRYFFQALCSNNNNNYLWLLFPLAPLLSTIMTMAVGTISTTTKRMMLTTKRALTAVHVHNGARSTAATKQTRAALSSLVMKNGSRDCHNDSARRKAWISCSPTILQQPEPFLTTTTTTTRRNLTTSKKKKNPKSHLYHIEVSNAAQEDCTQLIVTGPDMDGVLASMTIALAMEGCSVVDLHANTKSGFSERIIAVDDMMKTNDNNNMLLIHDVFLVVDRTTGQPFANDQLERLAHALLRALQEPPVRTLGSVEDDDSDDEEDDDADNVPEVSPKDQITIIRG